MSQVQKSSRQQQKRFLSGSTRERNGKNRSTSEADFGFGFDSIEADHEFADSWEPSSGNASKKSSLQKYATDDNCVYGDAGLHRSSSDFGIVSATTGNDEAQGEECRDDPAIIRDCTQLQHRLEMMHDRCIARNLRAAGLGGYEAENDNAVYGVLDPNAHMITGETMLTGAIIYVQDPDRQARYTSILLSEGADVNTRDALGKTALMHACARGYERVIKTLLQHDKTDLLIRDNDGNTALMYASAFGASKILKLYFKSLRKYEKTVIQQKFDPLDDSSNSNSQANLDGAAATATTTAGGVNVRERLWSFSGEDPLDMQNWHGNTARALALKNGYLDCANLLNEERLRRAKEMNKRLNSISHQRVAASPSLLRTAKKSAKKYMPHSSSFDSVYFDQEDRSDDDLMQTKTTPSIETGKDRRSRPPTPDTPTRKKTIQEEQQIETRSVRLKKRFQSNPDLYRLRGSGSYDETIDEDPASTAEFVGEDRQPINATTKRRQTVQGDLDDDDDDEKVQQPRKYSMYVGASSTRGHQPIIGSPSSGPGAPAKRNLTEKLINFLRRRPKYFVAASNSELINSTDRAPSPSQSRPLANRRSCGQSMTRQRPTPAQSQQRSTSSGGFTLINNSNDGVSAKTDFGSRIDPEEEDEDAEDDRQRRLRKNNSQPDIRLRSTSNTRHQSRKASDRVPVVPAAAAVADDELLSPKSIKDESILKRRSVDLSFMSHFRNQFISQNQKNDDSISTITPLANQPPSVVSTLVSQTLDQYKTAESGSNLPRLQNSTSQNQRRQKPNLAEKSAWTKEETSDSGLASSAASSAAGSSRPVSADSNTSHKTNMSAQLGRR